MARGRPFLFTDQPLWGIGEPFDRLGASGKWNSVSSIYCVGRVCCVKTMGEKMDSRPRLKACRGRLRGNDREKKRTCDGQEGGKGENLKVDSIP